MVTVARILLAAVLSAVGIGAFAQELIIFTDNRSLQVQSHRVDGVWTYLRLGGSGEMAVPSASILRVDNERTTAPAAVLPQQSAPSQATAVSSSPAPASNGVDAVRRPNTPPPVAVEPDDEEDMGEDEEMDEPEPVEPPPKQPDVPQNNPGAPQPPGMMQTTPGMPPGMPPRPGVFPQQNNPNAQPQKPVDED